jgi:hypothetical protein
MPRSWPALTNIQRTFWSPKWSRTRDHDRNPPGTDQLAVVLGLGPTACHVAPRPRSQHLRQIRADRAARAPSPRARLRAQFAVASAMNANNISSRPYRSIKSTGALDAQHIELADQVAEDDRAVAGHVVDQNKRSTGRDDPVGAVCWHSFINASRRVHCFARACQGCRASINERPLCPSPLRWQQSAPLRTRHFVCHSTFMGSSCPIA